MTVRDLKEALQNVPDDTEIVFQGNIKGEYDSEDGDDMTHTTCVGNLFSVFLRDENLPQFVLDCAITDSE